MNSKNFRSELFNSAGNERNLSECSSNSFHSVPFCHHTFSGTGSPSKDIKESVNLEKQSQLFESQLFPFRDRENFACGIHYPFSNIILHNVLLSTREVAL